MTASSYSIMLSRILNSFKHKENNSGKTQEGTLYVNDCQNGRNGLPERNAYRRPIFLALDECREAESLSIQYRPIITTNDKDRIPLGAGYAECINGGKSDRNEDQAAVGRFRILNQSEECHTTEEVDEIDVYYYGIFDGHAGPGAALMAADQLINHLQEKLVDVNENLFHLLHQKSDKNKCIYPPSSNITLDDLVVGALEAAFVSFDEHIARERMQFSISGGCAAVVAIILLEKLYVAHAGDCRAIAFTGDHVREMAVEFTPETDSQRIQSVAHLNPSLTQGIFSDKIFQKALNRKDLGKKVLYKAPNHCGWQSMIVTEADLLKSPLVIGQGKWAKLMGIIGVARGFGDHDLKVTNTDVRVKSFLTPLPEVRILDLADFSLGPDDVLVMGCDGLWDLLSNDQIKMKVRESIAMSQTEQSSLCYNKAAESIVHLARGDNNGRGWKMADGSDASFDDICAFVIPLQAVFKKQMQNGAKTEKE